MRPRPAAARGFTLIEVLVAIGIAAIGLAAALAVITNTAGNAASQRTRTLAGWIALNQITKVRLGQTLPNADVTKGDIEFANLQWKWEQNVTQTDVAGIRRIDVRVRLADDEDSASRATVTGFAGRVQMSSPPVATDWDSANVAQRSAAGGGTTIGGPGSGNTTTGSNAGGAAAGGGSTTTGGGSSTTTGGGTTTPPTSPQ